MNFNLQTTKNPVQSAVMVLHDRSTDSLILTKRSDNLQHHPGEICFPGGRWEAGDVDFYATALRELEEELHITADRVQLVRALDTEQTLLGAVIYPWLATIETVNPYEVKLDEVVSVIAIPMALVVQPGNYKELPITRYGHQFISCEFVPHEELVWGATARIMKQLVNNDL